MLNKLNTDSLKAQYESVKDVAIRFHDWSAVDKFVEQLIENQKSNVVVPALQEFKENLKLEEN